MDKWYNKKNILLEEMNMKTWKLVSGILSMVLFALVGMQSCAVGLGNAITENGESSGSAGIILSVLMLSGGIVSVAVRNAKGKSGDIALVIIFGLAFLLGFPNAGSFSDLKIWSVWCLINAILAVISMLKKKERKSNKTEEKL